MFMVSHIRDSLKKETQHIILYPSVNKGVGLLTELMPSTWQMGASKSDVYDPISEDKTLHKPLRLPPSILLTCSEKQRVKNGVKNGYRLAVS